MKYGGDYYTGSLDEVFLNIYRLVLNLTVSEGCTKAMEDSILDGLTMVELMEKELLFSLTVLTMKENFTKIVHMVKTVNINPIK